MKLASFEIQSSAGPIRRIGAVTEDTLVDLTASYAAVIAEDGSGSPNETAEAIIPTDMVDFLKRGKKGLDAAENALSFAIESDVEAAPDGARLQYDLGEVRLLAPLPRPTSIRDFMVFEEHVQNSLDGEIPDVWYEIPVYYKGNPGSVVHPGEDVQWPSYTEKLDYELELAAVIGKRGRDIAADEADEYIAGYTIFNDFSARDIQMKEMQGKLGPTKGKDFANGFGPYLVTKDELDIENIHVTAKINGDTWSEGNTGEMYHSFAEIIEYVSQDETLYPGDVLGTGTVGKGCGLELDKWVEPGDTIELEAEGIGTLQHSLIRK